MQKMLTSPIGIFDSGLGGLSILSEIHKRLPLEDIIYYADSNNAPYGQKSRQEIIDLSIKNTEWLLSKGCKLIVVACNTATTNAIDVLRSTYEVPFIGIEPAIKPAALKSITKRVGILATKGTLSSQLFNLTSEKFDEIKIIEVEGKGIVEAIESNNVHNLAFQKQLKDQLEPFNNTQIDYLVLGCSHYPLIMSSIKSYLDPKINIIDSGYAVAKHTENILSQNNLKQTVVVDNNRIRIKVFTNRTSTEALISILNQLKLKKVSVY